MASLEAVSNSEAAVRLLLADDPGQHVLGFRHLNRDQPAVDGRLAGCWRPCASGLAQPRTRTCSISAPGSVTCSHTDDGISEALMRSAYYAVVGAGSAGCIVARRLAGAGVGRRLCGIESLRVTGTAITASVTRGNTDATTLVIGERCAAMMRS
jgi:hypothetical protein